MRYHDQMIEIVRRRERLLARCDAQRSELTVLARLWARPLKLADRAIAGVNYVRNHPAVVGVVVAVLAVIQRRGWWGWVKRGFVLWRAYRALSKSRFTL